MKRSNTNKGLGFNTLIGIILAIGVFLVGCTVVSKIIGTTAQASRSFDELVKTINDFDLSKDERKTVVLFLDQDTAIVYTPKNIDNEETIWDFKFLIQTESLKVKLQPIKLGEDDFKIGFTTPCNNEKGCLVFCKLSGNGCYDKKIIELDKEVIHKDFLFFRGKLVTPYGKKDISDDRGFQTAIIEKKDNKVNICKEAC